MRESVTLCTGCALLVGSGAVAQRMTLRVAGSIPIVSNLILGLDVCVGTYVSLNVCDPRYRSNSYYTT